MKLLEYFAVVGNGNKAVETACLWPLRVLGAGRVADVTLLRNDNKFRG